MLAESRPTTPRARCRYLGMLPRLSFVDRCNGDPAIYLTTDEDGSSEKFKPRIDWTCSRLRNARHCSAMPRLAAPVNHETDLRMKKRKI
jgi:hypothetical protein